jgi:hypothetical protein
MDELAPCTRRDFRARERVEGMLVNVVATWAMLVGERLLCIDRMNDVADF